MYATHYDPKLAGTIYSEVFFAIDFSQFPANADLTYEVEGRIHEQDDAMEQARKLANQFSMPVAVSVYGTWGYYGQEYIEDLLVQPSVAAA